MKLRLITALILLALCLGLLAGCGEEAADPTGTGTGTATTTVPTMSWEEKDAQTQAQIAASNAGLAIALRDLGVTEEEVIVHTITTDENRTVEMFLQLGDVMYHYVVDTENNVVLDKTQD